jgi:formate/nitrite transporter FocA (FNT family)
VADNRRSPESRGEESARDNAAPGADDELEQKPQQIADRAEQIGQDRLDRSSSDIAITGLIGGFEVSLGGLAAMTVMGAVLRSWPSVDITVALALGGLAFPVGFLFVILGRSELFTENFLIPVVSVLSGQRSLGSLLQLWGLSWLGNLAGCAATALLLSFPGALDQSILDGYRQYAEHKLDVPLGGSFVSGMLAGLVMTALTWLLLALRHPVARMFAITWAGFLLFAANLSHSIVGASELFVGFRLAERSILEVAQWQLVATLGNLVGGVGLVTLYRTAQARESERKGA